MDSIAKYQRIQDDSDGSIRESVRMDIDADTPEEREECLHDLMVIHEVLEEYGVFKKNP